jgi:hypothetical protein
LNDSLRVGLVNSDYVLLQSALSIYNNSKINRHATGAEKPAKHFFLDAGTSMFSSSLSFFLCAYSQRRIAFNEIHGWEVTSLEPNKFWSEVPEVS